jgi:hypothetical protein
MDRLGDLDRLARSFERNLRAENKSAKTVATYGRRSPNCRPTSQSKVSDVPRGSAESTLRDSSPVS